MNDFNLILILVIGALQIGDLVTTEKVINAGGREMNPVMKFLFDKFGMHNVLVTKVIFVITMCVIVDYLIPGITSTLVLLTLALMYSFVVWWNYTQSRK